ncbi:MAG: 50S ribosomal protein L25 [Candidatus Aquicultor sp.]|nr:50S ribosomal protein L25 [Candidatus Aquicultor sp.]
METAELKAEKREVVGKESSKKLRREGRVPAVLYSDGESSTLTVDARDFRSIVHSKSGTNVIVKLKIEGMRSHPSAIIKEIQKNPLRSEYFHIDFQKIAMDEKINAMVPISVIGEAPGVKEGGMLEQQLWEVELLGLPADMPGNLVVDVSTLEVGDTLHARDIAIPADVELVTDPESTLLAISLSRAEAEVAKAVEGVEPELVAGGGGAAAKAAEEKAEASK